MWRAKIYSVLLGVQLVAVLGCGASEGGSVAPGPSDPMDAGISDAALGEPANDPEGSADAAADAGTPAVSVPAPVDAGEQDATGPDGSAELPVATGVDTMTAEALRAGQRLVVSCLLLNNAQESFVPGPALVPVIRVLPAEAVIAGEGGALVAVRAGDMAVSCSFPSLGLDDVTPATVHVLPGSAVRTVATLDQELIRAGEQVAAACSVFDAWGNAVPEEPPQVRLTPAHERNFFEGTVGTLERAGRFAVTCHLDGAESVSSTLEVTPALPASLLVARVPDKATYALGETVSISSTVADRFGNPIPSTKVAVSSEPAGTQIAENSFSFSKAGLYHLTATVTPRVEGQDPLSKTLDVLVDAEGPIINCDSPANGAVLHQAAGGNLVFRGSAGDPSGVTDLRVNGVPTAIDASGQFVATISPQFGINFIDLAAIDSNSRQTRRTCAFLAAEHWVPDGSILDDTLSLRLRQAAVDDSSRDTLNSLADLLHAVLGSDGLRQELHAALMSNRVLKSGCDQALLGRCVLSSRVTYLETRIDSPSRTSLKLIDGGLISITRFENLAVQLQLDGQVGGIDYKRQGWVTFESIEVETAFDIGVGAGQPRARVRPGTTKTTVGRIGTEFSGVEGMALELAVQLANGLLRDYVASRVQIYVTDHLNTVLDGMVAGLGVNTLGQEFSVARMDTEVPIALQFGGQFSSVSTTLSRMVFGMGTRFSAPPAHARPTLGAPVPATARWLDVDGPDPLGVAIHEGVFNQGLHALWRAGYFDVTLDAANNPSLPAGLVAEFSTQLPPVAEIRDTRVQLSLGGVSAQLSFPELSAKPVPMTLGTRASMAASLVGNSLVFSDFRIDETHVSIDSPDLDAFTRSVLESAVPSVIEYVVDNALRDSLPSLPVPSFTLPSSLSGFGLPAGASFGIADAALAVQAPHLVLRGDSGIR